MHENSAKERKRNESRLVIKREETSPDLHSQGPIGLCWKQTHTLNGVSFLVQDLMSGNKRR